MHSKVLSVIYQYVLGLLIMYTVLVFDAVLALPVNPNKGLTLTYKNPYDENNSFNPNIHIERQPSWKRNWGLYHLKPKLNNIFLSNLAMEEKPNKGYHRYNWTPRNDRKSDPKPSRESISSGTISLGDSPCTFARESTSSGTATAKEKKIVKVPCPGEDDVVCVSCYCQEDTGFKSCEPVNNCPKPVTLTSRIRKKDKLSKCPYGKKFTAQCTLCECSGEGRDHCAMCYALPVRRTGQPEELNERLPQVTDNRFFNYEINGWEAPVSDDK